MRAEERTGGLPDTTQIKALFALYANGPGKHRVEFTST
jgi:hypothetical protein